MKRAQRAVPQRALAPARLLQVPVCALSTAAATAQRCALGGSPLRECLQFCEGRPRVQAAPPCTALAPAPHQPHTPSTQLDGCSRLHRVQGSGQPPGPDTSPVVCVTRASPTLCSLDCCLACVCMCVCRSCPGGCRARRTWIRSSTRTSTTWAH